MEFFKSLKSLFTFNVPSWISMVETFIAFLFCLIFALYCNSQTEQEIKTPNGAEYLVKLELNESIVELIEDCKLKEVNDTCEVKVGVKVTMIVAPRVEEKREESKAEEKSEEAAKDEPEAEEAETTETEPQTAEPKKEEVKEPAEQTEKK